MNDTFSRWAGGEEGGVSRDRYEANWLHFTALSFPHGKLQTAAQPSQYDNSTIMSFRGGGRGGGAATGANRGGKNDFSYVNLGN